MATKLKDSSLAVTSYNDVRLFLKDYLAAGKKNNPLWNVTAWARELGLESTTALTMILNGQRNIGQIVEHALVKYFSFSEKELRHFQMLIKKEKLPEHDPLKNILESEVRLNTQSKPVIELSAKSLAAINHWYFFAIRQLARLKPVPRDQQYFVDTLKTNEPIDFCAAIDTLVQQGLLVEIDKMYFAAEVVLSTTQNIPSESLKNCHEEFGTLAVQAIRKFDVTLRNFQSCNFTLDRKNLPQAHKLIEKFISDFETLIETKNGDSVYNMNVQLFPLAVLNENNSSPS